MPHLNMSLDDSLPNQSCKKELPEGHTKLPTHNTSKVKEWVWNLRRAQKIIFFNNKKEQKTFRGNL